MIHSTIWINLKRIILCGKNPTTFPKVYILCDSKYITFLKWQISEKKDRWVMPDEEGAGLEGSRCGYSSAIWGILVVMEMSWIDNDCIDVDDVWSWCVLSVYRLGKLEFLSCICYNCLWLYNYFKIKYLIIKNPDEWYWGLESVWVKEN